MNLLSANGVSKTYGLKTLFTDVSLGIDEGERVSIVGVNGSGKSTLIKVLSGAEKPDSGEITVRKNTRIECLRQFTRFDEDHTVLDHVFSSATGEALLVRKYEESCRALEISPQNERLLERVGELSRQMDAASAWEFETRVKTVLTKLNIKDFDAPVSTLSGGYRRRLALARSLIAEPDILFLDEPTNHLDADTVDWLEQYIRNFNGAVVMVTHDRYFLDRVAERILEIDSSRVFEFPGNYSLYLKRKSDMEKAAVKQRKRLQEILRREIDWLEQGCKARTTKQDARIKRIQQIEAEVKTPARESLLFSIFTRRLGKKVLELEDVKKFYDGKSVLGGFTYTFRPGERVGIIGPNGCGKTTLANIMTDRVKPDEGSVEVGKNVRFAFFDQECSGFHPEESALDYVKREGGEMLRTLEGDFLTADVVLKKFYFTPQMQFTPVKKLSGGERRRLYLVRTLMLDPNFLILDEPTNDLDIPTLQSLEDFLDGFSGCLVCISHDRYFLDRTVDHILAFEPDGSIRDYPGNYSIYSSMRQEYRAGLRKEEMENEREIKRQRYEQRKQNRQRQRKLSYNEQQELVQMEKEIPELEQRLSGIEGEINASASDYAKLIELNKEKESIESRLETCLERWETLASIQEKSRG